MSVGGGSSNRRTSWTTAPVFRSRPTAKYAVPFSVAVVTHTRSPQTTGDDHPLSWTATFQRTFSPSPHFVGAAAASETPSPFGPRYCGQLSPARAVAAARAKAKGSARRGIGSGSGGGEACAGGTRQCNARRRERLPADEDEAVRVGVDLPPPRVAPQPEGEFVVPPRVEEERRRAELPVQLVDRHFAPAGGEVPGEL